MIKKWLVVCSLMFVVFSCATVNAFAAVSINSLKKSVHAEKDFSDSNIVTMETEHEVYATDVKSINLLITNNSQKPISFVAAYALEVNYNGQWYSIPFKEGFGFDGAAFAVKENNSGSQRIQLQHEAFNYIKGQYRVVKKVDNHLYQAKFKLGKSAITAETPYGFLPMEKLPSNYTRREAATAGDIVITKEGVMNNDAYAKFLEKTNIGMPAMLRITNVEDVRNPKIMDIIYDECYLVREGNLATISKTAVVEKAYAYLNAEGSIVYFSNYVNRKQSTVYDNTDNLRIPLQNESTEGKKAAEKIYNSMKEREGNNATTFKIYSPDRLLNANLVASPLQFSVSGKDWDISMNLVDEKNIANKIMDIHWIDNSHFMLTCDTSEEQKYFAVYEVKNMKSSLTFSQYGTTAPNHTINMNLKDNS